MIGCPTDPLPLAIMAHSAAVYSLQIASNDGPTNLP
jgi:hypothetical protein